MDDKRLKITLDGGIYLYNDNINNYERFSGYDSIDELKHELCILIDEIFTGKKLIKFNPYLEGSSNG